MNGEHPDAVYTNAAAAAVAAAVASLPADPNGVHHLTHAQMLALQGQVGQEADREQDAFGSSDGQVQARKPRKLRKPNDVARCQVDGCGRDLSDAKLYLRRYSVCEPHFKAEWVMLSGGRFRFCQQCNKFQPLDNFAGNRRSCKARSEDRNLRRRKQRTDERAMAGDDVDGVPGRLLPGGHPLVALALPSRAALGDNGMLRQLGTDASDPATQLAAAQYASQVQQLLLAGSAGVVGGAGLAPGGQMAVQVAPGMDLAAAAALVSGDLGALGGGSPNANALSLLSAAAAANSAGRAPLTDPAMSAVGGNVLQQLQLAQLANALSKGGAIVAGSGGANGALANGGGAAAGGGAGGAGTAAAAAAGGLAAALGGVGVGLNTGALNVGGALAGNALTQQLLMQQAQQAAAAAGAGGAAGMPSNTFTLPDGTSFSGNLDLSSLMAQQLLQQTNAPGQAQPVLLLHNQNVMLVSLDSLGPLGLLPQQPK